MRITTLNLKLLAFVGVLCGVAGQAPVNEVETETSGIPSTSPMLVSPTTLLPPTPSFPPSRLPVASPAFSPSPSFMPFIFSPSVTAQTKAPVVAPTAAPVVGTSAAPVVDAQTTAPIIQTPAPVVDAQTTAPIIQTPAPVVDVQTPAPVVDVQTPAPVVDVQTPAPVVDVQTPAPIVDAQTTAPVVAALTDAPVVAQTAEPTAMETVSPTWVPVAADTSGPTLTTDLTTLEPSLYLSAETHFPTVAPTLSFQPSTGIDIEYYSRPELKWFIDLGYSGKIKKGNAVTLSPDNKLLYITTRDGRVTVLHAHDGSERWSYKAEPLEDGMSTRCTGGVYFGVHPVTKEDFAIYAVADEDPNGSVASTTSRIIAISHPYNRVLFTSQSFPGQVVGTPVVTHSPDTRGRYIFVNTNVETTDGQLEGFFSVMLTVENGSIHYTEGAGSVTATDKFPYAPLAVAHKPQLGKFPYGLVDNNDIVVWGTSHQEGRGQWGYTRAFQIPENYDPLVMSLSTVRMVNVSWTTTVRPTLSNDGYEMYAVGQSSQIAGWVGSPFSFQPSWMATLDADEVDPAAPIPNAAILSRDSNRLFTFSTTNVFYAIDAKPGILLWNVTFESTPQCEAKVSPDDERVYIVEAETGTLRALDQLTGAEFYSVSCNEYDPECGGEVQGEFAISSDGLYLYYANINGQISAMALGESLVPLEGDTGYPTFSPMPTMPTTPPPSTTAHPTWRDEGIPSSVPSGLPSGLPSAVPTGNSFEANSVYAGESNAMTPSVLHSTAICVVVGIWMHHF